MNDQAPALMIVGGGRWARVYLSVLAGMDMSAAQIVIVSRHGGRALADVVAFASRHGTIPFVVVPTVAEALQGREFLGAIVANSARDHAATAVTLLERSVPVLLEKPVALESFDAERLLRASRTSSIALVPSLILRYCEYLRNFTSAARAGIGSVRAIDVTWSNPASENRYGEAKSFDAGLGIAEEVGPHIWTLLTAVAGDATYRITAAEFGSGGLAVRLKGWSNEAEIHVSLQRQAATRKRQITLSDGEGRSASLDFSAEPGAITVDQRCWDADPDWLRRRRPLARQLERFFELAHLPSSDSDIEAVRESTAFTCSASELVRRAQRRWLHSPSGRIADPNDRMVAVREILAPLLVKTGLVAAGDNEKLDAMTGRAMTLMSGTQPDDGPQDLRRVLAATELISDS
jgi:predicted dehydrogenase